MNNINNLDFMITMRDLAKLIRCSAQALHKIIKENNVPTLFIGNKLYVTPKGTREILTKRGFKYHSQIIVIEMLKGGVGKTSTAINLAIRANHYGARVLCVDLDQQANLSFGFNHLNEGNRVWLDIVEGTVDIEETIINVSEYLDLIPSNLNNSILDKELTNGKRHIGKAVSQYLEKIKNNYDLIIIDTGPNLGATNMAAACAANTALLPVNPDKFSFLGLEKTIDELKLISDEFGTSADLKILFTKFDGREVSSHELLKKCYHNYSDLMLKSFIRTNTEIKNTIQSKTVFYKNSTAKEDYDVVTREILGFE